MRPEENHRLRWEGVAWEGGLHGDSTIQVTHGKTDSARREVPMSPRVREILRARWKLAGKPREGWIWPNTKTASGHVEPSTLKKLHGKACRDVLIMPFVLYAARHTSLTRLEAVQDATPGHLPELLAIRNSNVNDVRAFAIHGGRWLVGAWWESRKNPKAATSDAIVYMENRTNTADVKSAPTPN